MNKPLKIIAGILGVYIIYQFFVEPNFGFTNVRDQWFFLSNVFVAVTYAMGIYLVINAIRSLNNRDEY